MGLRSSFGPLGPLGPILFSCFAGSGVWIVGLSVLREEDGQSAILMASSAAVAAVCAYLGAMWHLRAVRKREIEMDRIEHDAKHLSLIHI